LAYIENNENLDAGGLTNDFCRFFHSYILAYIENKENFDAGGLTNDFC